MDENMTVYESIECTNVSYENYTTLPSESKLGDQSENFWLESKWKANKIDDVHANLSLENKSQLITESSFRKHWVKSKWDGKKQWIRNKFHGNRILVKSKRGSSPTKHVTYLTSSAISFKARGGKQQPTYSCPRAKEIWTKLRCENHM